MSGTASPYLTQAELCTLLRVDARSLQRWAKAGQGPPVVRLAGRWLRYERRAVDAWLAERTTPLPA